MFGIFKKKERELPAFNELSNSTIKDNYFLRLAVWDWLNNETIHVFDNNAPKMFTLDPWLQLIYIEADGQKTISEFVYQLAGKYGKKETIPEKLDSTILEMIEKLLKEKLIALSPESKELPYYIKLPKCEQNLEKAKQLMLSDGFIKE